MRYRRNAREVDAILFDGTHASAAQISARFGDVSYDGGRIEVNGTGGRVFAGMGCWIVRDCRTRMLNVIEDREFVAHFEQADDARGEWFQSRLQHRVICDCPAGAICKSPDCVRLKRAA